MTKPVAATSDIRELRRTLGCFATGVTVVTTLDATGQPRGMTANSFTSVSLEPALILVCVAKSVPILAAFDSAEGFAVNILDEQQRDLSTRFATPSADKFAGVSWRPRITGAPVLDNVLAYLDCRLHQRIDAGDHVILIGAVADYGRIDASPLLFCRGSYGAIAAETAPDFPTATTVATVN
ncbi:flavin reductase family protein [Dongia soli]|uniref:Flavin reductase family protein n=1 Tax=Dongia soli TaxID=600628 RepID=A0ABU5EGM4_9PROT|nr:flavin reductase family protein [Dongia soli]MDY0885511.1 flavin reductase family protein [Dongia soli]